MVQTAAPTRTSVPLARPSISEEDIAAVVEVLRSGILSLGPNTRAFEQAMADYAGVRHGIAVNSGTSGLHLCLAALGVGPGQEVVTSPFSFVASPNAAIYVGATPVFADIDPYTLNLDPALAAERITDRTAALLPVDIFGQPVDVEGFESIAAERGLPIVADTCEAIGAERNGRRAGSWGAAAVFAFYPNKQMTTGEGGCIVTDDEPLARAMRSMANQGRDDTGTWMNHVRLGYNYRLDEMSAALGLSQLARLDAFLARRAQVAAWYTERLARLDAVETPHIAAETTRMSWFVYVVRLAAHVDRPALMAALESDGIPTRPYFVPLHLQPYYRERYGFKEGDYPITERIAATTLALPFATDMTEDEVDHVCSRITGHIDGCKAPPVS